MKVFMINSVVDYGSTGKIVRDLANGLEARGHDVRIAYGRMQAKDEHATFDLRDKRASAWHLLMTRLLGRHGLHSKKATVKLINEIEAYQADLIHLHNLHGYYLDVKMLMEYLKTKKLKVIVTLHDCWLFSGSMAYFDYHGCKTWDQGCVECNSTKDYPQQIFSWRQKKNFKWKKEVLSGFSDLTVVTPSDWLSELAKASFLGEYPVITINNGIDLELFKPEPFSGLAGINPDDIVYLGLASIWEARKGLDYLYQLSDRLASHQKLVIVGLNEKQLKSVPDKVIGISRTSDFEALKGLYSRADVYLNPTLEDNFPTTNLEALACGTPILSFATGGSGEALDEETGWLIERGNAEAFIATALGIAKKTEALALKCRQRAVQHYDKALMIQRYIELMER